MALFHDSHVRLDFQPIVDAAEAGLLDQANPAFSPGVSAVIGEATVAGYNVNPLDPVESTGNSPRWLLEQLDGIANDEHPRGGPGLAHAKQSMDLIVGRADRAAQMASLPPTMRWIGGLAVSGLLPGQWSAEAIAKITPQADGTRLLEHEVPGQDGYTARLTVRELTPADLAPENQHSLDPAVLVRDGRFGAVAAEFLGVGGWVGFSVEPSDPDDIALLIQGGEYGAYTRAFDYGPGNRIPPYYESQSNHARRGGWLTEIQEMAAELTDGRHTAVSDAIRKMIEQRYVKLPSTAKRPTNGGHTWHRWLGG